MLSSLETRTLGSRIKERRDLRYTVSATRRSVHVPREWTGTGVDPRGGRIEPGRYLETPKQVTLILYPFTSSPGDPPPRTDYVKDFESLSFCKMYICKEFQVY